MTAKLRQKAALGAVGARRAVYLSAAVLAQIQMVGLLLPVRHDPELDGAAHLLLQ